MYQITDRNGQTGEIKMTIQDVATEQKYTGLQLQGDDQHAVYYEATNREGQPAWIKQEHETKRISVKHPEISEDWFLYWEE